MINVQNVTKRFADFVAVDNLSCEMPEGCVCGLVGSNGAGKSTLLRLMSGVFKADSGTIEIDGTPVYENPSAKEQLVFVPDELYFLPQANMNRMAQLYKHTFPNFSEQRFATLTSEFGLDPKKNLNTFSKGMRRQAATILALACLPKYLFLDETFDGLDPVMRNLVKQTIYKDVCDRGATAIISSHSLRELEDTCDQLALIHKGALIFESEINDLATSLIKIQVAFNEGINDRIFGALNVVNISKRGRVATLVIRGDAAASTAALEKLNPIFLETLPLSLEEVFIYEMESVGYNFGEVVES